MKRPADGIGWAFWLVAALLGLLGETRSVWSEEANDGPAAEVSSSFESEPGLAAVFELFGMDESAWRLFEENEVEPATKLLHVLSRLEPLQRYEWSQLIDDWQPLLDHPERHRDRLFELSALVTGWERVELPVEVSRRLAIPFFYRVEAVATRDEQPIKIFVARLPSAWNGHQGQPLKDPLPIRCSAVLVKVESNGSERPRSVWATHRLAWYPSQADQALRVSSSWAELASRGMDIALFDSLSDQPRLLEEDAECFYQMLWTARRLQLESASSRHPAPALPIAQLLANPSQSVGQAFRVEAVARRAIRVAIEDESVRRRLGLHHYYEVECSMPIPDTTLKLRDQETGAERDYSRFPVTVCFPALPPGFPQGDQIRQEVVVDGYFLKLWSYRSAFTDSPSPEIGESEKPANAATRSNGPPTLRQLSPLLIGVTLASRPAQQVKPMAWPAWILAVTVGILIVALAIAYWTQRPSDRRYRRWRRREGDSLSWNPLQTDRRSE